MVLPTCPGVVCGKFDPTRHQFKNFTCNEILDDFILLRNLLQRFRSRDGNASTSPPRFILTVSPVPLVATATNSHVLPATVASKATLRAAAAQLFEMFDDVDYFPSYELISSPWSNTCFYDENLRSVSAEGVRMAMDYFFREHGSIDTGTETSLHTDSPEDVACDEVILEALSG